MEKKNLIIGTRGSKLALWQAHYIKERLESCHPHVAVTLEKFTTTGDKILDVPLAKIGGKGLFTKELEIAMLDRKIDLAVHSLKDVPAFLADGLCIGALTEREDEGDALISVKYDSFAALPPGATIGTSSLRRKAQLLRARPDLNMVELRGNLDTRLRKLDEGQYDAIVLAVAGLKRLGWQDRITEILPKDVCLPAVGQGALAIECRCDDQEVLDIISVLHHEQTAAAVTAERAFLQIIEGGCQVPVGVYGRIEDDQLRLEALISSLDGKDTIRKIEIGSVDSAVELGQKLAKQMLDQGGREILATLPQDE